MWNELKTWQKVLIIISLSAIVPFMPELIFLADLGGIELIFTLFVLYYKPQLSWIKSQWLALKTQLKIAYSAFKTSSFLQPNIYALQSIFFCFTLLLTGSLFFSSVFFLPAFLGHYYL